MKKAILYGNYTNYLYHPLKGVDEQLKSIFKQYLDINSTEDLSVFKSDTLNEIELLILYKDNLDDIVKANHAAAVISYVSNGGRLLILHNGISFFNGFEFSQMAGGKFDYHPEIRNLTFKSKRRTSNNQKTLDHLQYLKNPTDTKLNFTYPKECIF